MSESLPRLTGLNHVAFATADLDATIAFWRDLIGLRLVFGCPEAVGRQYFFEIAPGSLISFFEWEGVEPPPYKHHGAPVRGPFAFDHLAIGVADLDALWQMQARLDAADIPVSDVVDHGFLYSIYSHDPNHIPLEFNCRVPGVDVSAQPRMGDPQASALALEGAEPRSDRWPEGRMDPTGRVIVPGGGKDCVP
ncbi:MAG: VOC family protein [Ectothiorhodospiraceae bacterium]|nr:VOC family protein [Ectothiorhodospiraceae bacterium]